MDSRKALAPIEVVLGRGSVTIFNRAKAYFFLVVQGDLRSHGADLENQCSASQAIRLSRTGNGKREVLQNKKTYVLRHNKKDSPETGLSIAAW